MIGKTGPKGSSHANLMSVVTLSNKVASIKLPSLCPLQTKVAPFSFASSISSITKSAALLSISGTIVTSSTSNGFPIFNLLIFSFNFSTNLSATEFITNILFTAVHLCPE